MSDKRLPSSLDEALAHVDPDRRKFLGMLLAGVATVPLLTSAVLNAEDNTHFPKSELKTQSKAKAQSNAKSQTWTKGGVTSNDDKRSNLKAQDVKHNEGGAGARSTVKHGPLDFSKSAPADGTNGKTIKNDKAVKHQ
ncbi:MAG: hypothetical protein ACLQGT_09840 [Terracidiphilus sp.]